MSTEILTPAGSRLLITKDEAKTRLVADAGNDALLDRLVAEASRAAESYLGRPLTRTKYRFYLAGHGSLELRLPVFPIEEPTLVEYDGSALTKGTDWRVSSAERGVLYFPNGTRWTAARGAGPGEFVTPFNLELYKVETWAGWLAAGEAPPDPDTSIPVPDDIKDACYSLVEDAFEETDSELSSESVGPISLGYARGNTTNLKRRAVALLEPYRRWTAAA